MKKLIIILCLVGLIAGMVECQNYNKQQLSQAMGGWQSKIDMAHLDGKSPDEVSAFLAKYHVAQEPYSGLELVHDKGTSYRQGYILAHTRNVAYIFGLPDAHFWSVKMCFTFDEQNKCRSNFVYAEGS